MPATSGARHCSATSSARPSPCALPSPKPCRTRNEGRENERPLRTSSRGQVAPDHGLQHAGADRHHRDRCRPGHVMDAPPTGAERGDPAAIAAARYIQDGDTPATRTAMDQAACSTPRRTASSRTTTARAQHAFGGDQLQVFWPPVGPLAGEFAGRPEMVQVIISANHESFFGQFLGQPEATVTTGAVAARETESANSNSLVALDPDSCAAGWFTGNGVIHIAPVTNPDTGQPYSGGYVHVNSSCNNGSYNDACSNGNGGLKRSGNASGHLSPRIFTSMGHAKPLVERSPAQSLREHRRSATLGRIDWAAPGGLPGWLLPEKAGPEHRLRLDDADDGRVPDQCLNGATVTLTPGVYWGGIAVTSTTSR